MEIPTWEEFSVYLTDEKKFNIPPTFYGKFEYIRDYFLTRPFTDINLRKMISLIRQDLYYRQSTNSYAKSLNEYLLIIKLINEYHTYQKKQSLDLVGEVTMDITWEQVKAYYYIRKHNRGEERNYKGKFNEVQNFFYLKPFTIKTIEEFLQQLEKRFFEEHNKKISSAYYNKYLSILRTIGELLKVDVMSNFQSLQNNYEETEALSNEEVEKLLAVKVPYSRISELINRRWKTIIKTFLITTARPNELQSVTWDDLKGNYLHFRMTKNGSPHKVYIPDTLLQEIYELKQYNGDNEYIFGSRGEKFNKEAVNNELKRRCELAGIKKKITCRSLRATGITLYLQQYPLHQVARISGHKTVNILYQHYYKPEEEQIADIVKHNLVQPDEVLPSEVMEAYRKVGDRFRNTRYSKIIKEIEDEIEKKVTE